MDSLLLDQRTCDETRGLAAELGPTPFVREALGWVARDAGLTPTVEARLMEIAAGLSYREITERHDISVNTVKTEVRTLLGCLGVSCRHQIEDAARAAQFREELGISVDEIWRFLKLRFE